MDSIGDSNSDSTIDDTYVELYEQFRFVCKKMLSATVAHCELYSGLLHSTVPNHPNQTISLTKPLDWPQTHHTAKRENMEQSPRVRMKVILTFDHCLVCSLPILLLFC